MHTDISQGNFYARIYSEKAGDQMEHPDLPPAIITYRRTLIVDTLFGEKNIATLDNQRVYVYIYIYGCVYIIYIIRDYTCNVHMI